MRANALGPYRGLVDLVHDGGTVNVKLDVGFDLTVYTRIRIDGINAPELSTHAGKDARDFARTLFAPGDAVESCRGRCSTSGVGVLSSCGSPVRASERVAR